jgi:uncharacterized membrane protein
MIVLFLILAAFGWLIVAMIFEAIYQFLKPNANSQLQKHQWCWLWWSLLGILSFTSGGVTALLQIAMIFCIAAGHISLASVKEEVISPVEIVKNIPQALRDVYERFRKI